MYLLTWYDSSGFLEITFIMFNDYRGIQWITALKLKIIFIFLVNMKSKFIIIFKIFFCAVFVKNIVRMSEHTKEIERIVPVKSIQTKRVQNLLPINKLPILKKIIKMLKRRSKLLFYSLWTTSLIMSFC